MVMDKIDLKWKSIGHLLEDAARQHEHNPLFFFEGNRLTYSEVNRKVNQVANMFKKFGMRKGDRVSVMLPNGFDFPITWLALGKIGAVMVPTNLNYKEHDLTYILTNSEASSIVIHSDYLPELEKILKEVPALKNIFVLGNVPDKYLNYRELADKASNQFKIVDVGENDMINIQYTSGTTGFPKGCMLTHRYWLIFGALASEFFEANPKEDVNLTAQPFYYMDPQWNTVLCLMNGIPLVIMHRFSPSKFWQTIKEYNVTFFYVLGTMPFYLLNLEPNPELEQNHKLKFVYCSGIVPQYHETFEKRWNVPWREAFGMTETGIDLVVPIEDTASVGSGGMGAPVRTKEAKVINEKGDELPVGEIGELVIRGDKMMLGYWKNPEATNKFFSGGWAHTGDLAYKDERGYFHWVGRIKDMVRRSAENISTAEVEGVLMEHDKIKLAAVVPVPDQLRGEEVKAYVVLKEGESKETLPPEEIITFAKSKLAYFKVPRYIEYVEDLPLTPSEKVAKHKLIAAKEDLRKDSYDGVEKKWH
jgi:acyl-coenzyme A synthetase/AMP-(fatty) acid ligase